MSRYPDADWVPWRYPDSQGRATYYRGQNTPKAVVLHIMQGWQTTARRWADRGMYPKSWHFSVGRDGSVMQHLDFRNGGYHAGITPYKARHYTPTWPLWQGPNKNVNHYTIGIEHEGFYDETFPNGTPFTEEQRQASRDLCLWLAEELGIPLDEDHFAPHAVIDLRDRPNDFATPTARKLHYDYLLERTPDMAEDEKARAMAEAAQERNALLNDVIVMQRDIDAAMSQPWPALPRIHKLLREAGELRADHEYDGDYRGYAE